LETLQLAENIVQLRHKYKITQEDLAKFLGVTKASISKWENGQSYPDIVHLPKLASYFDISIDQLFGYQPQMTKEKIKECYQELAWDFANRPFEDVMIKTKALVKEYYSCYPLLTQIIILWLNHYSLAEGEARQKEILESILELNERIINESGSTVLAGDAVIMKAMVQMQLKETQAAITTLEEILDPRRLTRQSDGLLIQAYLMNNEMEKAEKTAQISILLSLLGLLSNGSLYFSMKQSEPELAETILKRLEAVMEIFEADRLHPNVSISVYYQAILFYITQNKEKEALEEFKKFSNCCIFMISQGIRLHGDQFFTKLDEWFDSLELGSAPVRNEKLIIADLLKILENPALNMISKYDEYQYLKKYLEKDVENVNH